MTRIHNVTFPQSAEKVIRIYRDSLVFATGHHGEPLAFQYLVTYLLTTKGARILARSALAILQWRPECAIMQLLVLHVMAATMDLGRKVNDDLENAGSVGLHNVFYHSLGNEPIEIIGKRCKNQ